MDYKKEYKNLKERNICIQCKKEKAMKNRVRCSICLYLDKIYRQDKRKNESERMNNMLTTKILEDILDMDNKRVISFKNTLESNNYHNYEIYRDVFENGELNNETLCNINFQKGTESKEINGITIENLLLICLHRLRTFQESEMRNRENAIAITHIEDAILRLNNRSLDRKNRKVEGTMNK
jgi:hypothetical protein